MSYAVTLMIDEVAAVTGVPKEEILSPLRTKPVAQARAIACYVIREVTLWSWSAIGRCLDKDHTSVITGYRKIAADRQNDPKLDVLVTSLIEKLKVKHRRTFDTRTLDVIDLAAPIAGGSFRAAIGASAHDVQRLATGVLELWDLALAAETYVQHIEQSRLASDEDRQLARALGRAIVETMDAMRAPADATHSDTDRQKETA